MSQLQLFLLGVPEVRLGGRPVHLRTRKMLALLAYLAVEAGPQRCDDLAGLLWPGPPAQARAALRLALHHIRAALGGDTGLCVTRGSVELPRHPGLWVDALELEAWAGDRERPDPAVADLWRGEFLQGLAVDASPRWDDWVGARALEFAERFGALLARLAQAEWTAGRLADAALAARRWVDHDPLSGAAYQLLARVQRAAGQGAEALETERRCREVLGRELGAGPAPERPGPAAPLPAFLVGGPLIGRGPEFGRLVEVYRRAAGRAPQAALLSGEPGIGKTRLAGEVLAWAQDRGAPLLRGRALETAGQPFAALVEALRREQDTVRAGLSPPHLEDLARLLPELWGGPVPPAGGDLRPRLLEALGAAVLGLVPPAGAPLVLFVDDLHWADASTLDALLHLAARLSETPAPLLLLLTARSESLGTGTPLSGWSARLRRHLPLHDELLGPLDLGGTRHLLGTALPRAPGALMNRLTAWLFGETGGHPLYLTETLRGLLESGALSAGAGGPHLDETRLPGGVKGVRAAIGERLARLTPAALTLAQGAAVLGSGATFEVLRVVAGLDEEAAVSGYEELLRSGLLLEGPGHAHLSHDRVGETLRDALSGPRRERLHRRAFGALRSAHAAPVVLAGHALAGGLTDEAAAWYEQAGRAAVGVGAYDEGVEALEQALRLLPEHPDRRVERFRVLRRILHALEARDEYRLDAAKARIRAAAEHARARHLAAEEGFCLCALAEFLIQTRALDEAEQLLVTVGHLAQTLGEADLAREVSWVRGYFAFVLWDWDTVEAVDRELHALVEGTGDEALVLQAEGRRATMLVHRGRRGEAYELQRRLLERARTLIRDPQCPAGVKSVLVPPVWVGIADNASGLGLYREALAYLGEGRLILSTLRETAQGPGGAQDVHVVLSAQRGVATTYLVSLYMLLEMGDPEGAERACEEAAARLAHLRTGSPFCPAMRALLLVRRGQAAQAQPFVAQAVGGLRGTEGQHESSLAAYVLGDVFLELGQPEEARPYFVFALRLGYPQIAMAALLGLARLRVLRGDGAGAAHHLATVLAHGVTRFSHRRWAENVLADLRARFPADLLEPAVAAGAAASIQQAMARVQEETAPHAEGRSPGRP